jgi:Methyltransferase domain
MKDYQGIRDVIT